MPSGQADAPIWRAWGAEPPAHLWPTDIAVRVGTLAADAWPDRAPIVAIGGVRLPVLGRARIYVCGITPYDTTHVGHAATFVWADLAARVLRLAGVDVELCRNVTDIDDHLLAQAKTDHVGWRSLATRQTYRFERDMAELGVPRPTYEPHSYDHVDDVIALAHELLARGLAYERNGGIYFRGSGVHETAGLARDEAIVLARERGGHPDDPDKDDPLDAAIWQRSVDDEPAWPSPWGPGRPGWHAQCTAMALATLGASVDLHVGGADLAFPHHAYEAAQAEAYTGVAPFARAWMRVGSVMVGGEKMAKSTGNLVFVRDLLERWGPGPLRLLILNRRWQDPWDFDERALERASGQLDELWKTSAKRGDWRAAAREAVSALADDLNVPAALAIAAEAGGQALRDVMGMLGLH